MPPLTPEQIRAAYLASVPRMQTRFKNAIREFRSKIFHVANYAQIYPQEVLRLAEEELRIRMDAASEKVEALLESGWVPPNATSIREALMGCFTHDSTHHDPFSDLYAKVDEGYSDIGQPEPQDQPPLRARLGETQKSASEEAFTRVETYVVKNRQSPTVHNYGPIASQQIGDNNVASVSQSIVIDRRSVHNALQAVQEHLDDFPKDEREDVLVHLDDATAELDSANPRPSKLKASLSAIGRIAKDASLDGIKAIVEGAVSGLVKGTLGGP